MKGRHHIVIEAKSIKYEFDIKRNITVIQGDSATGKTTLIDLLSEYARGENRGIKLQSDVPCEVYTDRDDRWEYTLNGMQGSIVFIDEDYRFIYSNDFAVYLQNADNYFVLITRKPLKNLPYSINEIYGIRTTGKYHFPEQVYHEFYPIYSDVKTQKESVRCMILTEDKEAGYQFFRNIAGDDRCISANGNSGVYLKMLEAPETEHLLVIADGAAFGAFVENTVKYASANSSIALYFPESFEWMILKSGILENRSIDDILDHPEDYVDSSEYVSWERFFTALLKEQTKDDKYMYYSKGELSEFYTEGLNRDRILNVVPEEVRKLICSETNI